MVVHGNHSELQQVLLNLCLNARDAMPQGGRLRVAVGLVTPPAGRRSGRGPAVRDAGGLGHRHRHRSGDRKPGSSSRSSRPSAKAPASASASRRCATWSSCTAAASRSIRRAARAASSACTFRRWTCRPSPPPASARRPPNCRPAADRPISILLVDDEQLLRRSFGRLLRQHGFQVTEAAGGAEALTLYAAAEHDLVILDLDMPGMSGEATQVELLRRHPERTHHVRLRPRRPAARGGRARARRASLPAEALRDRRCWSRPSTRSCAKTCSTTSAR